MDDTGTRQKSFPMSLWLQFVLCTGVIFLSGSRLSLIADIIAEKTGLGRTWIGVILLASVKSLPELITAFRFFSSCVPVLSFYKHTVFAPLHFALTSCTT